VLILPDPVLLFNSSRWPASNFKLARRETNEAALNLLLLLLVAAVPAFATT